MLKTLGRRDIVKSRDNQIDNIKGLLILLVVFGHMLLASSNHDSGMLTLIYSFHMPAFIFLNGVFSKNANMKRVGYFGSLFVVIQLIYILVVNVTKYPYLPSSNIFITPIFHVWYLLSLTFWYFLTVLIKKCSLNRRIVLNVSLLAALLIRYTNLDVDGNFLSYMRTIVFAPYFVLGFYITREDLSKLRIKTNKYKGVILLISFFMLAFNYFYFAPRSTVWMKLFYGYVNCSQLNQSALIFLVKEIVQLLFGMISIFIIIVLVPSGKGMINYLGRHTLFIFICHPIIYFTVYNHIDRENNGDFRAIVLALVLSIISIVFSIFFENVWFKLRTLLTKKRL